MHPFDDRAVLRDALVPASGDGARQEVSVIPLTLAEVVRHGGRPDGLPPSGRARSR